MSTATQLAIAGIVLHECDFYRVHCTKDGYFQVTVQRGSDFSRACPLCESALGITAFSIGATNRNDLPYVYGPLTGGARTPRVYRGGRPRKAASK